MFKISKRFLNSNSLQKFDICVVGGGIVGTAFACSLAQSPAAENLKIALIEAGDLFCKNDVIDGIFSNRVSSFTPTSVNFLNNLNVWKEIPSTRKHPYSKMKVWDSISNGMIDFTSEDGIAFISENRLVQAAVAKNASKLKNITILNKAKVKTIEANESIPRLTLENGEVLSTELLVGADGANSKVRHFAGIDTAGYKYNQKGLVCTVSLEGNDNSTAWQRFLPTGPVAMLPVSSTQSSIVWSLTGNLAEKLSKLNDVDFVTILNSAFQNPVEDVMFALKNLGNTSIDLKAEMQWGGTRASEYLHQPPKISSLSEGSRASFPLQLQHSCEYFKEHIVLVGDAAHSVHPLAGQGLNLGLSDAEALSRLLILGLKSGQVVSDSNIFADYAAERYFANSSVLLACDSLSRLFTNESKTLSHLRSFGLNLLNHSSTSKSILMKLAS